MCSKLIYLANIFIPFFPIMLSLGTRAMNSVEWQVSFLKYFMWDYEDLYIVGPKNHLVLLLK